MQINKSVIGHLKLKIFSLLKKIMEGLQFGNKLKRIHLTIMITNFLESYMRILMMIAQVCKLIHTIKKIR